MLKVITTVGTSVFTNYFRKEADGAKKLRGKFDALDKPSCTISAWENHNDEEIGGEIPSLSKGIPISDNRKICAEIDCICELLAVNSDVEIHLLTTDSILSKLAAAIIDSWFKEFKSSINVEIHPIIGLSIYNAVDFNTKGISNLVAKLHEIRGESKDVLLNISGGYKAMIPILTAYGQLYKIPLCYIYEDSSELITIDPMPLNFDWEILEDYGKYIKKPAELEKSDKQTEADINAAEVLKSRNIVKEENGKFQLTLIGRLIADYYDRMPPFFTTTMGYFVEYKLWECYAHTDNYGPTNVHHSFKGDGKNISGDVDLLIETDKNEWITVEVKHDFIIAKPLDEITEKIIKRVKEVEAIKGKPVSETWLITYSYQGNENYNGSDEQKSLYSEMLKKIKIELPEITVRVKHFVIKTNINNGAGSRIIYQKFLGSSLKIKDIKDII